MMLCHKNPQLQFSFRVQNSLRLRTITETLNYKRSLQISQHKDFAKQKNITNNPKQSNTRVV